MYPVSFTGITVYGVYIHEPGGFITDLLIGLVCLGLLLKLPNSKDLFQRNWTLFIAMIGIGGVGGALVHGIPTVLGETLFYWMWVLKNIFIPIANYYAAYLVLLQMFPAKIKLLNTILLVKLVSINLIMAYTYSFLPVVIDIAITYILVIWLSSKLIEQLPAYKNIRAAFIVAFLSGLLYLTKYDIDPVWFSHKDMAHIFVLVSVYLIYKAILIKEKDYHFGKVSK